MSKSESYRTLGKASFIGTVNHKNSMYKLLKEAQENEVLECASLS